MPSPTFAITYDDGRTDNVRMRPKAQMRYEAETGEPLIKIDEESVNVTRLYKMAWYAAGAPHTLDVWIEGVEDVNFVDEDRPDDSDGEDHPTSPTPSSD